MSENEKEYRIRGTFAPGFPKKPGPLVSVITWHRPEEKPEAGKEYIVILQEDPALSPYWCIGAWYSVEGWRSSTFGVFQDHVLAWGTFKLPDIEEVKR